MASQILNHSRAQLLMLEQEYASPATRKQKSEVCQRINTCLSEALKALEKVCAQKPITQSDITELHSFRNDLHGIQERIGGHSVRQLDDEVNRIILSGADRAIYRSKATLKDKIGFLLERFENVFVGMVRTRIAKEMYYVWNQKLRFQAALKDIINLNEAIAGLKGKLVKSRGSQKLASQISAKEALLAKKESFVREYEKGLAAAQATRRDFVSVGGVRVAIETRDHIQLDSMYLSAQQFGEVCRQAGAKLSTLKISNDEGELPEIHGLMLNANDANATALLETLNRLKIFKDFSEDSTSKGNGWSKVVEDDKIYIIPDYELQTQLAPLHHA